MNENQTPLAVDAAGLRKSFGAVRAVDGVDLRVRPGEIIAFLGPNGAGKTSGSRAPAAGSRSGAATSADSS